MKHSMIIFSLLLSVSRFIAAQTTVKTDSVVISNSKVTLIQTLKGGAFISLKLKSSSINPLDWKLSVDRQPQLNKGGFDFRGHFISLGTWGMPSLGEQKEGIKLYGETNRKYWKLYDRYFDKDDNVIITTGFISSIEGLDVKRSIKLFKNSSVFKITEDITNKLPIGRPYNILQHATFGGGFVDKNLSIYTNAAKGFYQKGDFQRASYQNLENDFFFWKNGKLPVGKVNLEKTGFLKKTFLTTHIFSDKDSIGWAMAVNKEKRLLIGYIWSVKDYPWLNIWHKYYKEEHTFARAIEFATVGVALSFQELMEGDYRFFNRLSFEFIDAGETKTKSYYMYCMEIPEDVSEFTGIRFQDHELIVFFKTLDHKTMQKKLRF